MNGTESQFNAGAAGNDDLRAEVQSLRSMLTFTLLLSFVFSFFVFVYLLRQNSVLTAQVQNEEKQLENFDRSGGPMQAAQLFGKLSEYANTHPDYKPIFQKYSSMVSVRTNPVPAKK